MSVDMSHRIADPPISIDDILIAEVGNEDTIWSDWFDDFVSSPSLQYAAVIKGKSLGELEAHVSKNQFRLQDPERRDKSEQNEQQIQGIGVEMALAKLAEEIGLPIEFLSEDGGYAGDFVLMPDINEQYLIEVKSAQMTSKGQNVPLRASYGESSPEEAWEKEGIIPDVIIFAYTYYTGTEIIVAFEGCEPLNSEARGLLSREPREMFGGELYLYDRKYIRHSMDAMRFDWFFDKL